jgi:hypothetical protein
MEEGGTFQLFHTDVAKLDRDVAYVTMVVHVRCKCMALLFHLFFSYVCCKCVYLDIAYVSHICCKCFIWMFAYVCSDLFLIIV